MAKHSNNYNNRDNTFISVMLTKYHLNFHRSVLSIITSLFMISTVIAILDNYPIENVYAESYPIVASTRGTFDTINGSKYQQVELPSALSILNTGSNCPGELAIYVHGIWANKQQAEEQTDRVASSINLNNYSIPVIGYSWDSDTLSSLDDPWISFLGWNTAKEIANNNGPILADFITHFKDACPNDDVRIIAHSLGSRVILSAIQSIYDNYDNKNNNNNTKPITSVHLLGAAVNYDQVSKNLTDCISYRPSLPCSGEAIKSRVENFYNLYSPQDSMLTKDTISNPFCKICENITIPSSYQFSENNISALGATSILGNVSVPSNYHEDNVLSMIIFDEDSNKDNQCDTRANLKFLNTTTTYSYYSCSITKEGDNHMGYMGFRDVTATQSVNNSGAIKHVVSDWQNEANN